MSLIPRALLQRLARAQLRLRRPRGRVQVFCGAGLSAPSGLSVYRGQSGAWTLDPEALAAMDLRNWPASRARALSHLREWRLQALAAAPNPAHYALAAWKRAWPDHVTLVTQNVDGLLQRAGLSDSEVVEVHGSLHRARCLDCRFERPMPQSATGAEPCPACGSANSKPSVVFFHEEAPLYEKMERSMDPDARLHSDTFLAIGTSWRVIAPERLLRTRGRAMGLQLSVDSRPQPDLDPWMHEQFEGGAVAGVDWALRRIFAQWRMA